MDQDQILGIPTDITISLIVDCLIYSYLYVHEEHLDSDVSILHHNFSKFKTSNLFLCIASLKIKVSEKWKNVSHLVVSHSLQPHGLQPARLLFHGILQARILEWVAIPLSRGSSQPEDGTHVSLLAGGLFTVWATREA